MPALSDYEKQVYAAVLGKTIGVYLGRPFEGWKKKDIEAKWGRIDRYVHEDQDVPLVVADDDLSGTFTFIRALEDSGRYARTPADFFGQVWLDYLIEGKTILWWGGLGLSTEHTAYLRLKQGIPSPRSGSIAVNAPAVAEQIGAQIFIDAFGMVAPGQPALAARLARMAASVSHDGEAVHAAVVVAAMVSAAFVEKKMAKVIAAGLARIPKNSLIARIHHDIAGWVKKDGDWKKTFARIEKKYGYDTYGGNCHVVPNHAVMVLAWLYAPDDFHRALMIVNTAGWDTDCNAGNVGTVMALIVGLDRLDEKYDFRSPFADRLILPTADGSHAASDCLREALQIAGIGRKVMGWPDIPAPKAGAWHHFEMPGALHGYLPDSAFSGVKSVENVRGHSRRGKHSMRVAFRISAGRVGRISVQTLGRQERGGGYGTMGTPKIYPGQTVTVSGEAGQVSGSPRLRLLVHSQPEEKGKKSLHFSAPRALRTDQTFSHAFKIPSLEGKIVADFGLQWASDRAAAGEVFIDTVTITGQPRFSVIPGVGGRNAPLVLNGLIHDEDFSRASFSEDRVPTFYVGKNRGQGILATGNTDWADYTVEASVKIHLAVRAGIMARYRGLTRHISLQLTSGNRAQLILRHHDQEAILDEKRFRWNFDEVHAFTLETKGRRVSGRIDGKTVLQGTDSILHRGGAGLVWTEGTVGFSELKIR